MNKSDKIANFKFYENPKQLAFSQQNHRFKQAMFLHATCSSTEHVVLSRVGWGGSEHSGGKMRNGGVGVASVTTTLEWNTQTLFLSLLRC